MRLITMQSSGGLATRTCVSCGRAIAWDANVCAFCGHDYRMQMMPPVPQKKDSALPVAGGVLIVIASLGYFLVGGFMAASGAAFFGLTLGGSGAVVGCGILILLLGVIALLGGMFAIQKKHWGIAIIGGVLVIPMILGLIGLILVAVSRDSFEG